MKFLHSLLKFLISPFMIGTYFVFGFSWTALNYYNTLGLEDDNTSPLVQVVRRAHQYSNDMRLRARGPRPVSDRVSILTIDEKALQQEGRWPWPRGKIKGLIEELVEGGASVIAFDMIFAEPDNNSTVNSLNRVREKFNGGTVFQKVIDEELAQANTDKDLAASVEQYGSNLIMGTYFEEPHFRFPYGYQSMCAARLFETSPAADAWLNHNVETMVIPIDQTAMTIPEELPETLAALLDTNFLLIQKKVREDFIKERHQKGLTTKLNETLEIELANKTRLEQMKYCLRWLIAKEDSDEAVDGIDEFYSSYLNVWPSLIEEDESLAQLAPQEGYRFFRHRQLLNQVRYSGRWWLNLPSISQPALHMAYFNAFLDDDGGLRKTSLLVRAGNQLLPSLALRTYLLVNNYLAQVILEEDLKNPGHKGVSSLTITDAEGEPLHQIPVNEKAELTINYAGPQKMFSYISAADVLGEGKTAKIERRQFDEESGFWLIKSEIKDKKEFYKDRIFIFGATATGIYDLRVTPFEENYPGVETHANVVDNLLRKDFLVKNPKEEGYMLIFLLIGGILLSFLIGYLGSVWGLVLVSLCLATFYWIDKNYFFGNGVLITIIFPVFMTVGLYFILTIYKYFTEERSKKHLKGTFGKYVSPAIVDEILSDPSKIELGGSKEHITVFFSDVRGFTTISEKLDASSLSDLLNSYLTPMTEIIFKNKGTLDKYMGDAIMAFFGAPISYSDHAKYACRSALENLEKLTELQEEYRKKGLPMIDVGIGLNTGEMSVGNMGSETVRNYTVMGDAVNLGSRLEGINKQYGTRIILSEFTQKEIKDDFTSREIDWVRVKGKAEPVRIYELIKEGKVDLKSGEMLKWFNEGFHQYHEMKWDQSLQSFAKALDVNPADPVSKLYIQRCKDYQVSPPSSDWDGVFIMNTK